MLVQGEGAPAQLTAAVEEMNRRRCADVILIGRGGGSAEDLAAFNDEALARAIFASEIPVISAVGHETDFTICDFVADLRAPTPSAAAELAVPDRAEVAAQLEMLVRRMKGAVESGLDDLRQMLDAVSGSAVLRDPESLLGVRRMQLDSAVQSLRAAQERLWMRQREQLASLSARLDGMSPLKVMARGYAALSDAAADRCTACRTCSRAPACMPGFRTARWRSQSPVRPRRQNDAPPCDSNTAGFRLRVKKAARSACIFYMVLRNKLGRRKSRLPVRRTAWSVYAAGGRDMERKEKHGEEETEL